jgi:hypothetical protein
VRPTTIARRGQLRDLGDRARWQRYAADYGKIVNAGPQRRFGPLARRLWRNALICITTAVARQREGARFLARRPM